MLKIFFTLIFVGLAQAQNLKPVKIVKADTLNCRNLFVDANKMVAVNFNLKKPRGLAFKLFNHAGKITANGYLIDNRVAFDFTNRMPGRYFLMVYDKAGKVVFRRRIIYEKQAAPTIRAKR